MGASRTAGRRERAAAGSRVRRGHPRLLSAGMATVLGWDAHIGDAGLNHANAVELGGTPESAAALAMQHAVQKYGPQDWSTWNFRAEPIPKTSGAEVVRFIWRDGGLVRMG